MNFGGSPFNSTIRVRNNNGDIPANCHIVFRFHNKLFYEVLLGDAGPQDWWRNEKLVKPVPGGY